VVGIKQVGILENLLKGELGGVGPQIESKVELIMKTDLQQEGRDSGRTR